MLLDTFHIYCRMRGVRKTLSGSYSHHVLGAHYSMAQAVVKLRKSASWGYMQAEGWGALRLTVQTYYTLLTAGERCSSNKHLAPADYVCLNSGSHYDFVFLFELLASVCCPQCQARHFAELLKKNNEQEIEPLLIISLDFAQSWLLKVRQVGCIKKEVSTNTCFSLLCFSRKTDISPTKRERVLHGHRSPQTTFQVYLTLYMSIHFEACTL